MKQSGGKKLGKYEKPRLTVIVGGKGWEPRTHVERELERAVRELVYAMEGKNKNLRNVAEGVTFPTRMLTRRFRDAKRARNRLRNYQLVKAIVRRVDEYADLLFLGRHAEVSAQLDDIAEVLTQHRHVYTTGDHPKVA